MLLCMRRALAPLQQCSPAAVAAQPWPGRELLANIFTSTLGQPSDLSGPASEQQQQQQQRPASNALSSAAWDPCWVDGRSSSSSSTFLLASFRHFSTSSTHTVQSNTTAHEAPSATTSTTTSAAAAAASPSAAQTPEAPSVKPPKTAEHGEVPSPPKSSQQPPAQPSAVDLSVTPTMPTRMILKALHTLPHPPNSHELWSHLSKLYPDVFTKHGRAYFKFVLRKVTKERAWVKPVAQAKSHAKGGAPAKFLYKLTEEGARQPLDPPHSLFKTAVEERVQELLRLYKRVPGGQSALARPQQRGREH